MRGGNDFIVILGNRTLLGCLPALELEASRLSNLMGKADIIFGLPARDQILQHAKAIGIVDLTETSCLGSGVVSYLAAHPEWRRQMPTEVSAEVVDTAIRRLRSLGCLTPQVRDLDWGDLGELSPICRNYGYSRVRPSIATT